MRPVLITGADGFIGSHLVEGMVRAGFAVRAFVLYNSFNSWGWLDDCAPDVKGHFEVFAGDVRDPHGAARVGFHPLLEVMVGGMARRRHREHQEHQEGRASTHDQIPRPASLASCTAVSTRISSW